MNNVVVWLDTKEAFLFALKATGIEKSHLRKDSIDHHRSHKKDLHTDINDDHYFHELTLRLKAADQLLLMGPGLCKTHFKSYVEKKEPNGLAKKIIGIETLEQVTDNQILAAARQFFKKYDLFHGPV